MASEKNLSVILFSKNNPDLHNGYKSTERDVWQLIVTSSSLHLSWFWLAIWNSIWPIKEIDRGQGYDIIFWKGTTQMIITPSVLQSDLRADLSVECAWCTMAPSDDKSLRGLWSGEVIIRWINWATLSKSNSCTFLVYGVKSSNLHVL